MIRQLLLAKQKSIMGIIQTQSIRSTGVILIGFAVGAFNMLVLSPKILSPEVLGLTRVITDAGLTLATLCTLGSLPVIYKFFPFYKSYLSPEKNDLPFITGVVCLIGFIIMCLAGWMAKDIIVRKFSERSPLFVQFSYLVYPYCFFILLFMWMESFAWSFRKSVISNGLRELLPRLLFTILLILISIHLINTNLFVRLFSLSYLLPVIIIFFVLRKTKQFLFVPVLSTVTTRLGGKIVNFGLFIFGAQFLNLLSRTVDTFILTAKSDRGLIDTAVFTIATYIVTLMEVPQRSMNAVTIPILAEAWKNKDMEKIINIYKRSVANLLVIGLFMFSLIWLNIHDIGGFLGKDFKGIESIILFMGIGKLIDLGTGANSQIIGTSSYWKVDFITNVIYTVIALPLNYLLIANYGLMGAAFSTLISLTFYNCLRFGFLWYKFRMQPYSLKELWVILIAISCTIIAYLVPIQQNIIIDSIIRSTVFCILFIPSIYIAKISVEINNTIDKYFSKLTKSL
jgi:O-antigen/teichoic acid export membrane protein